MIGISSMLHGACVYRDGPNHEKGEQRSVKTGSKRMRKPDGNSIRKQAWPSHVARRVGVSRVGRNLGGWTGTVGGVVSGLFALPLKRRLVQFFSINLKTIQLTSTYLSIAVSIWKKLRSRKDSHGFMNPFPSFR